jgi:hypothetical protein
MILSTSFSEIGVGLLAVPPTKPVTLGVLLDQVPGIVVHFHFDQHVAGEELALGMLFWPPFISTTSSTGTRIWPKAFLHTLTLNALDQGALHALLEAGIGVNHVPALAHDFFQPRTRS